MKILLMDYRQDAEFQKKIIFKFKFPKAKIRKNKMGRSVRKKKAARDRSLTGFCDLLFDNHSSG